MKRSSTILLLVLASIFAIGQGNPIISNYEGARQHYVKKICKRGHLYTHRQTFLDYRGNLSYESLLYKSNDDIKYRLDVLDILFWNEVSSIWEGGLKDEYEYNPDGIIISKQTSEWNDDTSQWETLWQTSYTYDENKKLIIELESNWDDEAGQWEPVEKYESTYDASGNLILTIDYEWDDMNTQWIQESKSEFSYNSSGDISIRLSYEWDQLGNQWINEWRSEYSYDVDGILTMMVDHRWNQGTNQFIKDWKHEFTYNTSGQLTLEFDHEWDVGSSQWIPVWKSEYTYDSNGNLEQELNYEWEQGSNQWLAQGKNDHTYDNAYDFSQLILPFPFDEIVNIFNHMLLDIKAYGWDEANSNWINYYMYEFTYSEQNIGSVGELGKKLMKIYPNPVSELLFIDFPENLSGVIFELIDIQGRKVLIEDITNQNTLRLESLGSGIYFYRINTDDGRHQYGKIIKE